MRLLGALMATAALTLMALLPYASAFTQPDQREFPNSVIVEKSSTELQRLLCMEPDNSDEASRGIYFLLVTRHLQ